MRSKADFNEAAGRMFGDELIKDAAPRPYRADQYQQQLGIDIHQYGGFYCEVGHADSPAGPVIPASDRLLIKPILAVRQSRTGRYYVQALEHNSGLFNQDKTKCWIKTREYDLLLGDDYFDRNEEQIRELVETAAAQDDAVDLSPVQILGLNDVPPAVKEILDKLRTGTDFTDLPQQERTAITEALRARQHGEPPAEDT